MGVTLKKGRIPAEIVCVDSDECTEEDEEGVHSQSNEDGIDSEGGAPFCLTDDIQLSVEQIQALAACVGASP